MSATPDAHNGDGCLEGVRVVELAQFVFVPGGGALLSDHGAEVIKVEPLEGDPYRWIKIADGRQDESVNVVMEQNNRNKDSIAIDLKSAKGYELFLHLIETADVFMTSLRVDTLERLGVGVEALRARNPRLIYVRGNAVGFRGAEANRPGFDGTSFWARGGFAHAHSIGRDTLVRSRPAVGDHSGSTNIAMGVTMALYRRERTGKPSLVEVSLLSTALWTLSSDIGMSQLASYTEDAMKGAEFAMPLARAYRTADGRWIQLMFLDADRYWQGLCERIGQPDLARDQRFACGERRAANGEALAGLLDAVFASRPYAHWEAALANFDAPWELVQTVHEVLADPQVKANDYVFTVKTPQGVPVQVVAGPVSIDGSPLHSQPRRAPMLGEHTDAVLAGFGVSEAEREELRREGAIR